MKFVVNTRDVQVGDFQFDFVCRIEPLRGPHGSIQEYLPQVRSLHHGTKPLNNYGDGPFCRFRVPSNLPFQGVYLITVNDAARYVGECEHLSRRFGPTGYGSIQPRNCFVGGQATNCKINNLVLQNTRLGREIRLWFYATSERKQIEALLIRQLNPDWNGRFRGAVGNGH